MSNPVPPADEGFGDKPDEGFGNAPQQGSGDAPASPGESGAPASPGESDAPAKSSPVGKIILAVVVALAAILAVILAATGAFGGDKTKDAAIGDCLASSTEVAVDQQKDAQAEIVDCGASEAAYTVVGRIEGGTAANNAQCQKYFKEGERYFAYSSTGGDGYLLCLRARA